MCNISTNPALRGLDRVFLCDVCAQAAVYDRPEPLPKGKRKVELVQLALAV